MVFLRPFHLLLSLPPSLHMQFLISVPCHLVRARARIQEMVSYPFQLLKILTKFLWVSPHPGNHSLCMSLLFHISIILRASLFHGNFTFSAAQKLEKHLNYNYFHSFQFLFIYLIIWIEELLLLYPYGNFVNSSSNSSNTHQIDKDTDQTTWKFKAIFKVKYFV